MDPMSWTAIVPIKPPGDRKSRLAELLSQHERVRLSDALLWHVLDVLGHVPAIAKIVIVSAVPPAGWTGAWSLDAGRGLNAELQAASALIGSNVLVIHADLPALAVDDVEALIASAGNGVAIAPDRHQSGTNALAVADVANFSFSFGVGSFARHRVIAGERGAIVCRDGLALDIDFPDDFALALERGLLASWRAEGRVVSSAF